MGVMNLRPTLLLALLTATGATANLASGPKFVPESAYFEFSGETARVFLRHDSLVDSCEVSTRRWSELGGVGIPLMVDTPGRRLTVSGSNASVEAFVTELDGNVVTGSDRARVALPADDRRRQVVIADEAFAGLETLTVQTYVAGSERLDAWIVPRSRLTPTAEDPMWRRLLHWGSTLVTILAGAFTIMRRHWLTLLAIAPAAMVAVVPLVTSYAFTLSWRHFGILELVLVFTIWIMNSANRDVASVEAISHR